MITCPNCGNQEIAGAMFCSECGTQFTFLHETTIKLPDSLADILQKVHPDGDAQDVPPAPDDANLSLYIVDTGEVIQLEGLSEYTLGRASEDQPILPDIDLTPYHAYEYGVSRLHASITTSQPFALLTDFGSANGTELNGQKITANKPYPITHGDIFTLGKMKIQLVINR